ncbi:hypothetical protein Mapa_008753 [Marchantia paleacea]|nr:hypothetical protein Mapa_008753 [Marchantia paleacea]
MDSGRMIRWSSKSATLGAGSRWIVDWISHQIATFACSEASRQLFSEPARSGSSSKHEMG